MGTARGSALLALALSAMLAGCAGNKLPERFHTLMERSSSGAMAAAMPASSPAAGAPLYVDVLPVAVPAQVDRPEWVVRQADDSLLLLEQDRWAAPLRDELRGAIVDRLASRWGATDVRGVSAPAAAPWRVRVDVQRFESVPGREARLEAAWSIANSAAPDARRPLPTLVCRSVLQEPVSDASVAALAAAHRRALQRLVDAIGLRLRAAQAGQAVQCDSDSR
jgi:uncharacterized lipoprotein YmbA